MLILPFRKYRSSLLCLPFWREDQCDPHWAPMLFSDWDFTLTTQGRFFKAYLQGTPIL